MAIDNSTHNITTNAQATPRKQFRGPSFGLSISGTWTGTLELQERANTVADTDTWRTVKSWTANPTDGSQEVSVLFDSQEWQVVATAAMTGTAVIGFVGDTVGTR